MPATKPKPGETVATMMYARAAECKERLLKNLIAAEYGEAIDPQQFIDDAVGAGIPFSRVAEASETLHTRKTRAEALADAKWNDVCVEALEASRTAQKAVTVAQTAFDAARAELQAASQRANAAVEHSGQVHRQREEAVRTWTREMQNDAGPAGDVSDWRNITI